MNIKAYAKFNLTLDVKNKRGDGYHEISSLMQEISVCDELSILVKNAKNGNEVSIKCSDPEVPCDERNTCYKAVFAFFSYFGIKDRLVKINIKKGIPLRSGLGGGSSDAAAVINALNKILKLDAPAEVLKKWPQRSARTFRSLSGAECSVRTVSAKNLRRSSAISDRILSWPLPQRAQRPMRCTRSLTK